MPGALPAADGLHITYLGRSIVRKDGSVGQENPPVNIYGTHLVGSGDATLGFTAKSLRGTAVIRLYGDVPVVSDEFRREPDSIEIALTQNVAQVSRWRAYNGGSVYDQKPVIKKSVPYSSSAAPVVSVGRRGSRWTVKLNGTTVYSDQLGSGLGGSLWFGVSAQNPGDSWTLQRFDSNLGPGVRLDDPRKDAVPLHVTNGLQVLARQVRPGFTVGAAVALGPLVADSGYSAIATGGDFGQFTTENVLKWQFIHPQPNVYDFHEADALVAIAQRASIAVQGHTLVFGEANPAWVQELPTTTEVDKANVRQVMLDHITQTVTHFKGKIASWDVVNEPMADYDTATASDGLRQHIWYKAMGSSYIAEAFRAAHAADPRAKLFINDFGLEADGTRWQQFVRLVSDLKAQGVPIDGVGFEAHVYDSGDIIDPVVLRAHMRQLASLGLVSRISEMDVYSDDGTSVQAKQYTDVFKACFAEPSCVSWSTWGVSDRYDLSLDDNNRIQSGNDLLWDKNMQPTPAVAAIRSVLR